jgi:hypothetical protein
MAVIAVASFTRVGDFSAPDNGDLARFMHPSPDVRRTAVITMLLLSALMAMVEVARARPGRPAGPAGAKVEMRNVRMHITDDIALNIRSLRGRFVATRPGGIPNLDQNESYVVEVDAGEVGMDEASLNVMLNEHVFGHMEDPPVKDLHVTLEDGLIKQKGKLDKKIDIPFKVKGAVEATPDGKIRIHAKSIKSLGLPVKGLMKVLGIEMDDMMKVEAGHGLTVDDNDMIIDPTLMLPPPHLKGAITSVRVEGNEVVQVFGSGPGGRLSPPAISRNHIYWRDGSLRFGKLTMVATDLELIDQDPGDPFDFSAPRYNDMLVAGYSRNTASKGLKTYMPDYDDLKAGRPVAHTPGEARRVVQGASR